MNLIPTKETAHTKTIENFIKLNPKVNEILNLIEATIDKRINEGYFNTSINFTTDTKYLLYIIREKMKNLGYSCTYDLVDTKESYNGLIDSTWVYTYIMTINWE